MVPLSELDTLLQEIIPVQTYRDWVTRVIRGELERILDYQGTLVPFIEERRLIGADGKERGRYWRTRADLIADYKTRSGATMQVPGIILAEQYNVLRTDGVIIEALLGVGDGLDAYSHGLQDEATRAKSLANDAMAAELAYDARKRQVIAEKDTVAARLHRLMFPVSK